MQLSTPSKLFKKCTVDSIVRKQKIKKIKFFKFINLKKIKLEKKKSIKFLRLNSFKKKNTQLSELSIFFKRIFQKTYLQLIKNKKKFL